MPPESTQGFAQLPAASARIQAALSRLQQQYVKSLDGSESEIGRILAISVARQADLVASNLRSFDQRGSELFATGKNLQLLEDLMGGLATLDGPVRDQAQATWAREAMALRRTLIKEAPALGIDLKRTDFSRASLQLVQVAAQNSFGQLSDFSTLQQGQLVDLKTGLADNLGRGLNWRQLASEVEKSGIQALEAIPGFRRAFSLEERGRMIARTETVRAQTQLNREFGDKAGLTFGRSYLNWLLTKHHQLCLWAESMGWAPVADFAAGPGFPPRHTNCVLPGQLVWGPPTRATSARWYDGRAVEITTKRGHKLGVTLNHPILTPEGWVSAGALDEGCYVVRCSREDFLAASGVHPDDDEVPTLVEHVSHALAERRGMVPVAVPTAAEDFHGDGRGSEIHIVRAKRELRSRFDVSGAQPIGQEAFARLLMSPAALLALRALGQVFHRPLHATDGVMSGSSLFGSRFGSQGRHHDARGLGSSARLHASSQQPSADHLAGHAERLRQSFLGLSSQVALDDLAIRESDVQLLGEIGKADRVVSVRRFEYRGHVYNLDTDGGWFACEDIITHNCGCMWQQGAEEWVDPAEGKAAMAKDFARRTAENAVKIAKELFDRLPAHVQAEVKEGMG